MTQSGLNIDGWIPVFSSGTDYEADLVRDRLRDAGLDAVVLTHRDHAFNLNVGKMSTVRVLVAPHQEHDARAVLQSPPFTDDELAAAALSANPIVGEAADADAADTDTDADAADTDTDADAADTDTDAADADADD